MDKLHRLRQALRAIGVYMEIERTGRDSDRAMERAVDKVARELGIASHKVVLEVPFMIALVRRDSHVYIHHMGIKYGIKKRVLDIMRRIYGNRFEWRKPQMRNAIVLSVIG